MAVRGINPAVDLDWRGKPGDSYTQMRTGLNETFIRTGVPKNNLTEAKWGRDQNGKSFPTGWRVVSGQNKVAEVNIDDPSLVPSTDGPSSAHVGYQTPGKRGGGGAIRGHVLLRLVPVTKARIGVRQ